MLETKILVVDDEPIILELFTDLLEREGYKVITADSGEKALEVLAQEPVQVMFLDQQLPGMSGLELYRKIRMTRSSVVVYGMTGSASIYEFLIHQKIGFDGVFSKPISLNTILDAVRYAFMKINMWQMTIAEEQISQEVAAGIYPDFLIS